MSVVSLIACCNIDTGYGALDWKLRRHERVVPMERTNAMHVELPEPVDLVTIDVAWTRQSKILPSAHRVLKARGEVVSLIKPHYESAPALLKGGVLPEAAVDPIIRDVLAQAASHGFESIGTVTSPIKGSKGNIEILCRLRKL
jgi:23S rRNA (cytidine1920-2'-O)/16S rRNA (cytidine1409-2'-O)-methyltransferase